MNRKRIVIVMMIEVKSNAKRNSLKVMMIFLLRMIVPIVIREN